MMSIDTFTKKIFAALEEEFEGAAKISVREVVKNNGLKVTGLTVRPAGASVAPTIYLDGYYRKEQEGSQLFPYIVDDIISDVRKAMEETPSFNPADFMDWDWAKERLSLRLVSGINKASLEAEEVLHRDFLDLEEVLVLQAVPGGQVKVTANLFTQWGGVTEAEAFAVARAGLPSPELTSIEEQLRGMMRERGMSDEEIDMQFSCMPLEESGMYCLTNPEKTWGAAELLKPGVLEAAAEQLGGDFLIIPSSVHEVLLVRADGGHDVESLKEMIREVNATQVAPDEVLSDHPYCYSKDEGKLISLLEEDA